MVKAMPTAIWELRFGSRNRYRVRLTPSKNVTTDGSGLATPIAISGNDTFPNGSPATDQRGVARGS